MLAQPFFCAKFFQPLLILYDILTVYLPALCKFPVSAAGEYAAFIAVAESSFFCAAYIYAFAFPVPAVLFSSRTRIFFPKIVRAGPAVDTAWRYETIIRLHEQASFEAIEQKHSFGKDKGKYPCLILSYPEFFKERLDLLQ